MKIAVIGMRVHSGWGALVAVSSSAEIVEVVDRRPIVVADPSVPGSSQPYHFAATLEHWAAKQLISDRAKTSEQLATAAIRNVVCELQDRGYRTASCAILLASGRPLPTLAEILVSHPLIHTAEGEFFRLTFWSACERLDIPVMGLRERDLDTCAQAVFGNGLGQVALRISGLKTSIGSPWTEDQKKASLAAWILLAAADTGVQFPQGRPSLKIDLE